MGFAAAPACGGDHGFLGWGRTGDEHAQGSAKVGGDVVSTVDGTPITIADVQQLVNASGLSPRAALTRLQSQALLMGEAARRGYDKDPEVERVARRALTQALLARDIESTHASDAEVAAAYAKQHERFHTPERRSSTHVLAAFPQDAKPEVETAARELIEQAISQLALVEDPEPVFQALAQHAAALFQVTVQRLPLVAHDGSFVAPFDDALFSTSQVGVVPQPVRTEYGIHAVYVTSIVPRKDLTLEQATPELRAELDTEKRKHQLDEMNANLRAQTRVEDDAHGNKALGELEL